MDREKHATCIDVEGSVVVLRRNVGSRYRLRNSGIRKKHIELAFLCFYFLVQAVQVVEIGNVPLDASHISADFGHGLIQFRLPAARNEDVGSLFDKSLGSSKPDTAAAPGDDGDFST